VPVVLNTTCSSEEIISLITQRDQKGFSILYEDYADILFGVITRIVNDTEIAEELLKDTFEKIYTSIDQYKKDQHSLLFWIIQFARSISIDYLCLNNNNTKSDFSGSAVNDYNGRRDIEMTLMPDIKAPDLDYYILELIFAGCSILDVSEKLKIPVEKVKLSVRKALKLKANRV
jgi:RNA polymerase sigma-70 factor (ECF subfamily)